MTKAITKTVTKAVTKAVTKVVPKGNGFASRTSSRPILPKQKKKPYFNRKHKDFLFRYILSDKKVLLELYNALNGTDYQNEDHLEITTLEDVVYLGYKNDLSFLIGNTLNLYEHQSTVNPNRNSSDGSEPLLHPAIKIASRWAGCLLPPHFRTVSAVNAQTCLNCYSQSSLTGIVLLCGAIGRACGAGARGSIWKAIGQIARSPVHSIL